MWDDRGQRLSFTRQTAAIHGPLSVQDKEKGWGVRVYGCRTRRMFDSGGS
jgi:hypothetical protein